MYVDIVVFRLRMEVPTALWAYSLSLGKTNISHAQVVSNERKL